MSVKFDANTTEYLDVLKFYRTNITPYQYSYDLANGSTVSLVLKDENFCKLLAMDEFAPSRYKSRDYLDLKGLKSIEDGTISSSKNKAAKSKIWREYKNRIEYFPFLVDLLFKPEFIIFNPSLASTKIKADVLLGYKLSEKEHLHLFCNYIDAKKINMKAVTFIYHKNDKYFKGQVTIPVKKAIKGIAA